MKIKTSFGELEVPKEIEKDFDKYNKENPKDYLNFEEWFPEEYFDYVKEYSDKLCPKELAEFLIFYKCHNISDGGGYDKEFGMSFKDNGYEYFVTTFGWTGELETDPKNEVFDTLTYKEKIEDDKNVELPN